MSLIMIHGCMTSSIKKCYLQLMLWILRFRCP